MIYDPEHFWQVNKRKRGDFTLSAKQLVDGAFEYFQWITDHPMQEMVHAHFQGAIVTDIVTKMRAFTWAGLATFLGVTLRALHSCRDDRDEAGELTDRARAYEYVEQIIWAQKFEGAAAGLLNANLISRELGIAERTEVSGPDRGPIPSAVTVDSLEAELERRGLPRDLISGILSGVLPPEDDGSHELPEDEE